MSHRECSHPSTKLDRAVCRRAQVKRNSYTVAVYALDVVRCEREEGATYKLSRLALDENARRLGYKSSEWNLKLACEFARSTAELQNLVEILSDDV